jgi:hypothetical protein
MATLDGFLSAATRNAAPLELVVGFVSAWSPGNRVVVVLGNTVTDVAYISGVTLANGDAVALLRTGSTYLALGKVATG